MPFSHKELVLLNLFSLILSGFVFFILYRLCKVTAYRMTQIYRSRKGQRGSESERRVNNLLSRPGVRTALASRVSAARDSQQQVFVVNDSYRSFAVSDLPMSNHLPSGTSLPPDYDEVNSVASEQPPPSYHSKIDE